VPIVQVSLYNNEDLDSHYRLGQALQSLRNDGIVVIACGMAVHNLQDFRNVRATGEIMP
jgi:4,5-DOPA dioxygenase extradiol